MVLGMLEASTLGICRRVKSININDTVREVLSNRVSFVLAYKSG